ncbi:7313_t:CDS:2, partial [Cetraspora pellucida]
MPRKIRYFTKQEQKEADAARKQKSKNLETETQRQQRLENNNNAQQQHREAELEEQHEQRKQDTNCCIGRIYMAHSGEVKEARNFEELKTIDGITYFTFKESAQHREFLENDNEYRFCMSEAKEFQMPNQLHNLFDFTYNGVPDGQFKVQAVLQSLNSILQRHSKSVSDFDLPELLHFNVKKLSRIHLEELNYQIFLEDLAKADTLNEGQHSIYNE